MLLLDDLLLLPISGLKFVFRTLGRMAEEEYTNDAPIKQRLLELQLTLEAGEISENEYLREEAAIIQELREIRRRKQEISGLSSQDADQGVVFRARAGEEAGEVSVVWHQDRERKKSGPERSYR